MERPQRKQMKTKGRETRNFIEHKKTKPELIQVVCHGCHGLVPDCSICGGQGTVLRRR